MKNKISTAITKESEQYFRLSESQSHDFYAHVDNISIIVIEHNAFSITKRIEAYETIDGLFEHTKDQAMELTISLRIWGFVLYQIQ